MMVMLTITKRVMMVAAGYGGDEGEVNGGSIGGGCNTLAACDVYSVMSLFTRGLKKVLPAQPPGRKHSWWNILQGRPGLTASRAWCILGGPAVCAVSSVHPNKN